MNLQEISKADKQFRPPLEHIVSQAEPEKYFVAEVEETKRTLRPVGVSDTMRATQRAGQDQAAVVCLRFA